MEKHCGITAENDFRVKFTDDYKLQVIVLRLKNGAKLWKTKAHLKDNPRLMETTKQCLGCGLMRTDCKLEFLC